MKKNLLRHFQSHPGSGDMKIINRRFLIVEKPWLLPVVAVLIIASLAVALLVSANSNTFNLKGTSGGGGTSSSSFLCSLTAASYVTREVAEYSATPTQLLAILHYATSRVVPQQSYREIRLSFDVLTSLAPCNFLVFGLGHDSLMWTSLNPRGTTLFLEEDPKWVHKMLLQSPTLRVHVVRYPTRLSQADDLLSTYRQEEECMPPNVRLKGNSRCKLALSMLPDEVYEREWDVIMIDAPRGYFAEAPGRMGAIFSAAVMARGRTRAGVTHVFLHDVNRRVEKIFAAEFLCKKHLVKGVGRLWHFQIPPAPAAAAADASSTVIINNNDRANSAFC